MDQQPNTWTAEGVKGGLIRFYREIAGVGLMFPKADRPIVSCRNGPAAEHLDGGGGQGGADPVLP
jgi:hypothetical protein